MTHCIVVKLFFLVIFYDVFSLHSLINKKEKNKNKETKIGEQVYLILTSLSSNWPSTIGSDRRSIINRLGDKCAFPGTYMNPPIIKERGTSY